MKKKFKKVKNIVLELLMLANVLSLFICIAAVECNPKVASLIMLGNVLFLLLMAWANDWFEGEADGC